jgi:iron only hydrogenase large subunit-like protein
MEYLEFRDASCKDCYKCLRACPVKAISIVEHHARIIDERCILCGTCTHVCPQNAKFVHSEIDEVKNLLRSGKKVIATIAPSFVSSFMVQDFSIMRIALCKLGFSDAEETALGAKAVVQEYKKELENGSYKNFITSACPAVDRLIQMHYPEALPYLAKVASPMVVHARMIKATDPLAKIVFIGPCIAKKREAQESGLIDATLTFEDLQKLFIESDIKLNEIAHIDMSSKIESKNKAKYFPISQGIIKSFDKLPENYEYVAIDGLKKCMEVLESINTLDGIFLELNACDYACVNGPCSLQNPGKAIKANTDIRKYVNRDSAIILNEDKKVSPIVNMEMDYPRIKSQDRVVTEKDIKMILAKTGKTKKEDELNCGACGYSTCREKAWAVANGYANVEMCLPYMREKAESMAYEIIQNSPNGILVVDSDYKLVELSNKARKLLDILNDDIKGKDLFEYIDPSDFITAYENGKNIFRKKIFIPKTKMYVEMTITVLKEHNIMFGIMKDITEDVNYDEKLIKVRNDTINTTDEVIKKQMRVAQEIASLLGETTAESKVALLKLKSMLNESSERGNQ